MNEAARRQAPPRVAAAERDAFESRYDVTLIFVVVVILGFGLVMVASASTSIAAREHGSPLALFWSQAIHVAVALGALGICARTPVRMWERAGPLLMLVSVALLALVLLPGVGREANGATRWLTVGSVNLQPSELAKLFLVVYVAGYLARVSRRQTAPHGTASSTSNHGWVPGVRPRSSVRPGSGSPGRFGRLLALASRLGEHRGPIRRPADVPGAFAGIVEPITVLAVVAVLLKLEPDHGAIFVLCVTVARDAVSRRRLPREVRGVGRCRRSADVGGRLDFAARRSAADFVSRPLCGSLRFRIFSSCRRSLPSDAAAGWGWGWARACRSCSTCPRPTPTSYLRCSPRSSGFVGMVVTVALFTFLVLRALSIGGNAGASKSWFAMHVAYGIGLLLGLHAFINIGVNIGLLPTKGLTLPLMSYGGSSLVVSAACIGVLIRIDHEFRAASMGEAP